MPLIATRGVATARGFGFAGRVATLVSTTFTSNGTWVAPTGVTIVNTLSGEGADGTPDSWDGSEIPLAVVVSGYFGVVSSTTVESQAQTAYNLFPTTPAAAVTVTWTQYAYISGTSPSVTTVSGLYRVETSTTKAKSGNGWGASYTTPIASPPQYTYGLANMELFVPGTTGASSTALGNTFPGGTPSNPTAPVTTFTNVAVTPGASYPIVVPSGGYVTISYYV